MLFRKKIDRCCSYCTYAGKLSEEEMICQKKGVVAAAGHCRHFRYDPLKRIPPRPKPQALSNYEKEDFSL